ncbi:Selenocysteine-specific elongation factor, partial [Haemophilus influenzae]
TKLLLSSQKQIVQIQSK